MSSLYWWLVDTPLLLSPSLQSYISPWMSCHLQLNMPKTDILIFPLSITVSNMLAFSQAYSLVTVWFLLLPCMLRPYINIPAATFSDPPMFILLFSILTANPFIQNLMSGLWTTHIWSDNSYHPPYATVSNFKRLVTLFKSLHNFAPLLSSFILPISTLPVLSALLTLLSSYITTSLPSST